MKSETYYLAQYLPYKMQLKCSGIFRPNQREKPLIQGADATLTGDLYADIENKTYDAVGSFKPMLRPLTDVFKNIEHDGKWFVPAKVLWSVDAEEEHRFDVFGALPDYWCASMACLMHNLNETGFGDIQRLLEWHFDVFGLHGAGMAEVLNAKIEM
jgi:hypothetical protein